LTALAAALAALLLLSLYTRFEQAYAGAYECYRQAFQVAADAKARVEAGSRPDPPRGWLLEVVYADGTVLRYGSLARERCRAYVIAGNGVLIVARG